MNEGGENRGELVALVELAFGFSLFLFMFGKYFHLERKFVPIRVCIYPFIYVN